MGNEAKIPKARIKEIIEQTKSALATWPTLVKLYGVSDAKVSLIAKRMKRIG